MRERVLVEKKDEDCVVKATSEMLAGCEGEEREYTKKGFKW